MLHQYAEYISRQHFVWFHFLTSLSGSYSSFSSFFRWICSHSCFSHIVVFFPFYSFSFSSFCSVSPFLFPFHSISPLIGAAVALFSPLPRQLLARGSSFGANQTHFYGDWRRKNYNRQAGKMTKSHSTCMPNDVVEIFSSKWVDSRFPSAYLVYPSNGNNGAKRGQSHQRSSRTRLDIIV